MLKNRQKNKSYIKRKMWNKEFGTKSMEHYMQYFDIEAWIIGCDCKREFKLATSLAQIFSEFIESPDIAKKSQSVQQKYINNLDSLGGHLIAQVFDYEEYKHNVNALLLLNCALSPDGGPLIYEDKILWQKEIDTTCKELYKYLNKKQCQE